MLRRLTEEESLVYIDKYEAKYEKHYLRKRLYTIALIIIGFALLIFAVSPESQHHQYTITIKLILIGVESLCLLVHIILHLLCCHDLEMLTCLAITQNLMPIYDEYKASGLTDEECFLAIAIGSQGVCSKRRAMRVLDFLIVIDDE